MRGFRRSTYGSSDGAAKQLVYVPPSSLSGVVLTSEMPRQVRKQAQQWDPLAPLPALSLFTEFNLTENPVSESGLWLPSQCTYFSTCQTASGRAYGNQPNPNPDANQYRDAYAHVSGVWPANQRAEAIIYKGVTSGYMEVEIHLLGSDSPTSVRCYEIFVHQNGDYFTLAMWKGTTLTNPAVDPDITYFDIMADSGGPITAPADGDLLWAQIVGNTLTAGINGTTYITFDVTTGGRTRIPSGAPGMGFMAGASGSESANSTFGFKNFHAWGLP